MMKVLERFLNHGEHSVCNDVASGKIAELEKGAESPNHVLRDISLNSRQIDL